MFQQVFMMKIFSYKAYDRTGSVKRGLMTAKNKKEAARALQKEGLSVMTLSETRRLFPRRRAFSSLRRRASFCRQWSSLLSSGLPLTESLALIASRSKEAEKQVIDRIISSIYSGHSVAESVASSGVFPPVFTAFLHIGEQSGTLPEQLARLAMQDEKEDHLRRKIRTSLSYPLLVITFSLLLFLLVLTIIIPSFATLFHSLSIPLPMLMKIALVFGTHLQDHWQAWIFFLFVIIFSLRSFIRSSLGKKWMESLLFRFSFYQSILLIRFCHTLASLLESAVPLADALQDAAAVIHNCHAAASIMNVRKAVLSGIPFAEAFEKTPFSSPDLCRMIAVGTESGELPSFLKKTAVLLEEETERRWERFRAILEPSLLLLSGILTGSVIFMVMLPIFETAVSHM